MTDWIWSQGNISSSSGDVFSSRSAGTRSDRNPENLEAGSTFFRRFLSSFCVEASTAIRGINIFDWARSRSLAAFEWVVSGSQTIAEDQRLPITVTKWSVLLTSRVCPSQTSLTGKHFVVFFPLWRYKMSSPSSTEQSAPTIRQPGKDLTDLLRVQEVVNDQKADWTSSSLPPHQYCATHRAKISLIYLEQLYYSLLFSPKLS